MNQQRRRWLAPAFMLALGIGIACAQAPDAPPPGPPPPGQSGQGDRMGGPDRELKNLTRVLTLTPEQQTGVKAVLEQQATQMRALRGPGSQAEAGSAGTPDARQARMAKAEQIRDESNTKIAALLDDNQKKLFADWTAKRKAAMERRRGQGDGPPPDGAGGPPPPAPNE
jgi:Spy/CpxP family protein refolding chaperone